MPLWTAACQALSCLTNAAVCSNSWPLSQWCYLTISSSAAPFSFCLQSFPASGSFPVSQLFKSSDQVIGASASTSVLPMNIQGWFSLELTDLIFQSKGTLKSHLTAIPNKKMDQTWPYILITKITVTLWSINLLVISGHGWFFIDFTCIQLFICC